MRILLVLLALSLSGCILSPDGYGGLTIAETENARARLATTAARLDDVGDVRQLVRGFTYLVEPVDWWPSILFIFARMDATGHYYGDCQTAAVMGHWALERIGHRAGIWYLQADGMQNHTIAVSDDGLLVVDGSEVYEIQGDWRNAMRNLYPWVETFKRR
jgi:hypothetical protein